MVHYINWRPTSVIKKHSLPSETEYFFLNKEGDTTPPRQRNRAKVYLTTSYTTTATNLTTPNLITPSFVAEHQTNKQLHQEKPPQDDFFFGLRRHQRRGDFFQGFQTSPDQEGLIFFGCRRHQEMIARGSRRHLRSPFPG